MITVSLKEFIKTGMFGPITIGSSRDEAIKAFGVADHIVDFGETQSIQPGAYYEFFCWTDTGLINGIQNDHLQAESIKHAELIFHIDQYWELDPWFLKANANVTFGEVCQLLKSESIAYVIEPIYPGCEEEVIRIIESNVKIDFCNEYRTPQTNKYGELIGWNEFYETDQNKFVLNGIRLFDLS
jgi:hypothetical protein